MGFKEPVWKGAIHSTAKGNFEYHALFAKTLKRNWQFNHSEAHLRLHSQASQGFIKKQYLPKSGITSFLLKSYLKNTESPELLDFEIHILRGTNSIAFTVCYSEKQSEQKILTEILRFIQSNRCPSYSTLIPQSVLRLVFGWA